MQSDNSGDKGVVSWQTLGVRENEKKKTPPAPKAPAGFLSEINGIDVMGVLSFLSCR